MGVTVCGKVWGHTSALFNKNNVEIHRLYAEPGSFCSEHRHASKWNAFYVESGELLVRVWKPGTVDDTHLHPGNYMEVAPGDYHQFIAEDKFGEPSAVVAYEIYWVSLDASDIDRRTVGRASGIHRMPPEPDPA